MSIKLCTDTIIPKYYNGKWIWKKDTETCEFIYTGSPGFPDYAIPTPTMKFGIKFKDYMNQIEEIIFRSKFLRPDYSRDSDVITIQDIKDVVLFLCDTDLTDRFLDFFHTPTVDQLLNDLIIYFEYFLKVVEFLLIRRDERKVDGKVRNMDSVHTEKMIAEYLCQYRLMLARDYSKILLGDKDVAQFHHMANKMKKSKTEQDSIFFETFICFCTRVVWVAMHRKGFKIIDCEVNRLFRSGHFNVAQSLLKDCLKFSPREEQILYGPNDRRCNYRNQRTPLILEILNIKPKNLEILWIGEVKYRGMDPRICQLELEYVTPEAQLSFVDCHHGILGNPKTLYNTMLTLDWHAVRKEKFSANYDPYQLVRRPWLPIPDWDQFNKHYNKVDAYFKIINEKFEEDISERQKELWKLKNEIIMKFGYYDLMGDNIYKKCAKEIENIGKDIEIDKEKIIANFLREKERKLKKKTDN